MRSEMIPTGDAITTASIDVLSPAVYADGPPHRQFAWFAAAQDAVDIGCRLPKQISRVRSVGHETAIDRIGQRRVDPGQPALPRQP